MLNRKSWWAHASWEKRLVVYASAVLTLSLLVQIIATVLLGAGRG
jgi:hypothetical protein